jgi:tetratricopeptide (TPR) repeat protein
LYIKSVKALHALNPSAKTAYGLGNIATTDQERLKYWNQALELGVDNNLKSFIHYKKGNLYKSKGQYGKAKQEYILSNQAKPSFGTPFLKIAEMIAKSGSSCGETPFEKRAINWVAARYADKAGRVDPSLKSNASKYAESYRGTAPGKQDVFMSPKYNSGDTITFRCWVGESVRIP